MSKRCPDCGFVNEDSKIYCSSCGEPLDDELRLMRGLEKQKKKAAAKETAPAPKPEPAPQKKAADNNEYTLNKLSKEKKFNPVPLIILGVIVVAVIVAIVVLM